MAFLASWALMLYMLQFFGGNKQTAATLDLIVRSRSGVKQDTFRWRSVCAFAYIRVLRRFTIMSIQRTQGKVNAFHSQ